MQRALSALTHIPLLLLVAALFCMAGCCRLTEPETRAPHSLLSLPISSADLSGYYYKSEERFEFFLKPE